MANPGLSDLSIAQTVVFISKPSSRPRIESTDLVSAGLADVTLAVLHGGLLLIAKALVLDVVALCAGRGVVEAVFEELAGTCVCDPTDRWCFVVWLVWPEIVHPNDELALPIEYV